MTAALEIRRLAEADTDAYREVRLRAVREHPDAFLTSEEEELARGRDEIARRFRENWVAPDNAVVGAFRDGALVGLCGFCREGPVKLRHRAMIWGMYVAPEARGLGLGRALLTDVLRRLAALPGIEKAVLGVLPVNQPAVGLYRALGFRRYGLERRAWKLGERYLDEELMEREVPGEPSTAEGRE